MVKTAALVVIAIILGVIMLNIIDDGSTSHVSSPSGHTTTTTSSTSSTTAKGTTPTTVKVGKQIPPGQLRVFVLNAGSGVNGAANTMFKALKNKGYVNQGTPGNTTARNGTAIECRGNLSREAHALQIVVAQHAVVLPFPSKLPAGVDNTVQCLVLIGKPVTTTGTTTTT